MISNNWTFIGYIKMQKNIYKKIDVLYNRIAIKCK